MAVEKLYSCWISLSSCWSNPATHPQTFSSPGKTYLSKTEQSHPNLLQIHKKDQGKIFVEMESDSQSVVHSCPMVGVRTVKQKCPSGSDSTQTNKIYSKNAS